MIVGVMIKLCNKTLVVVVFLFGLLLFCCEILASFAFYVFKCFILVVLNTYSGTKMTTVWSETYGLSHTGKRPGGDCLATSTH